MKMQGNYGEIRARMKALLGNIFHNKPEFKPIIYIMLEVFLNFRNQS